MVATVAQMDNVLFREGQGFGPPPLWAIVVGDEAIVTGLLGDDLRSQWSAADGSGHAGPGQIR